VLQGGAGDDTLVGGAGNDTLDGGEGINTLSYVDKTSAVSLTLLDTFTAVTASSGTERDSVMNFRHVVGGAGQDTLTGNGADNDLSGGDGNDSLSGLAGADTLRGGAGNDILLGGEGNDSLLGEAGDDTLMGGAGADVLDGGEGVNTVSYANSAAVEVNLTSNNHLGGDAAGDSLTKIQNVIGSIQNDTLMGDINANQLQGGDGNDSLFGGQGNDTLQGDAGHDRLDGGEGNDTLTGGLGNDTLIGGFGFDWMDGSAGSGDVNVADYSVSALAVTVDLGNVVLGAGLGTHLAQGDVLSNIQKVVGSEQNDTFILADSSVTLELDGGLGAGVNTVSRVDVNNAGQVTWQDGTAAQAATFLSLSGIHFAAV
jgi:Ca2+-binding RTX toxin-like protein